MGSAEDPKRQTSLATQKVTPLTQDDLSALVAFDARYFGAERAMALAMCLRLYADRALLTCDATGAINGYLIALEERYRTVDRRDARGRRSLLAQALTLPYSTTPSVFRSGAEQRRYRSARTTRLHVITRTAPHALWRRASAPAA